MWAYSKLLVIIAGMLFLGSIGINQEAYAATFTSVQSGDWNVGSTWNQAGATPGVGDIVIISSGHTVTLDASDTILELRIQGTLEVGDGVGAANSVVITITGISGSAFDVNFGTLDIKSDGKIHSTNTGVDIDITNGGTVTVSGSLEVERDVDLVSGSITNECGASIDVTTVFSVPLSTFGMDIRSGATYTQRGPLNGMIPPPPIADPPLHIRAGGIYIDDTASCIGGTSADLSITKSDDTDPIVAGNTLTYTVTVNNAGPDTATNVVVTDTLPAGVTFVSTSGCAEDPNGVPTCSLGSINSGGFKQYTIEVTVDSGTTGTITNSATVTSDTSDPDNGNNSDSEDTTVNAPPGGPTGDYGDAPDSYKTLFSSGGARHVTAGTAYFGVAPDTENDGVPSANADGDDNAGSDDEDGVILPATATAGSSLNINIPSITSTSNPCVNAWIDFNGNGVFEDNGIEEVIAQCGPVGPLNINVNVPSNAVAGDTYARFRIATDFSATTPTGQANNGEVEDYKITIINPESDLSITKTVDDNNPNVGDTIEFTVTVNNAGPDDASNVVVTDTLDTGLTFNSVTSDNSGGTFDGTTWTLGNDVPASGSRVLMFTANVNTIDPMFNAAEITASDQPDPDSTPGNGPQIPPEDDEVIVALNVQVADLRIEKTVDNSTPQIGDIVTYTVTVFNDGPDTATNVDVVEDFDPAFLSFNNFGAGNFDSAFCIIVPLDCGAFFNSINSGDSGFFELEFEVLANGVILNTAEIDSVDQFDPDSAPGNGILGEDDDASVTITAGSTADNGKSTVYQRPTIALPHVVDGFCFDLLCLTVEKGSVFTHLDLQTVDSGSTHTISVTVHCPSGVERCNYIAIGASPPGTDMRDATWKIILQKVGNEWQQTVVNDNGEIGDVTSTVQKVNSGKDIQASATIQFTKPSVLGSPEEDQVAPEGNQIINVEVRDSKGGYATYIFNEGVFINDIFAYPQVESAYDSPLVYEKLCLNEDEKDRNTCAFEKVRQWSIKQAEEKLKELYDKHGKEMDSYDESEEYKK